MDDRMYQKKVLSEQVASEFRQMILNKDLKPGDKLPNELLCDRDRLL